MSQPFKGIASVLNSKQPAGAAQPKPGAQSGSGLPLKPKKQQADPRAVPDAKHLKKKSTKPGPQKASNPFDFSIDEPVADSVTCEELLAKAQGFGATLDLIIKRSSEMHSKYTRLREETDGLRSRLQAGEALSRELQEGLQSYSLEVDTKLQSLQ